MKNDRWTFTWVPHQGCCPEALKRLKDHFPKPKKPYGEAWFMGDDRGLFVELMGDLQAIELDYLHAVLQENIGGQLNFTEEDDWSAWYNYLFPQLLNRAHERYANEYLIEYLIQGFITHYSHDDFQEPYKGFKQDCIDTLGRSLMDADCWQGKDLIYGKILRPYIPKAADYPHWYETSGDFSASLFFCLIYLEPEQIETWFESVLAIDDPFWYAQLISWFVGAHSILSGEVMHPDDLPENQSPQVTWACSNYQSTEGRKPILPEENREVFAQNFQKQLNKQRYEDWIQALATEPDLLEELCDLPERFYNIYIKESA